MPMFGDQPSGGGVSTLLRAQEELGKQGTRLSDDPTEQNRLLSALIGAGARRKEIGMEAPRSPQDRARAAQAEIQNILKAQELEDQTREDVLQAEDFKSGIQRLLSRGAELGRGVVEGVRGADDALRRSEIERSIDQGLLPSDPQGGPGFLGDVGGPLLGGAGAAGKMAGILGPGVPQSGALGVRAARTGRLSQVMGQGSFNDIVRLGEPENFQVLDEALAFMPTEQVADMLERTSTFHRIIGQSPGRIPEGNLGAVERVIPQLDLVGSRLSAELQSRALIGGDATATALLGGEELVRQTGPGGLSEALGQVDALRQLLEAAGGGL